MEFSARSKAKEAAAARRANKVGVSPHSLIRTTGWSCSVQVHQPQPMSDLWDKGLSKEPGKLYIHNKNPGTSVKKKSGTRRSE